MKCWGPGIEEVFTGDMTIEILDHGGCANILQVDKRGQGLQSWHESWFHPIMGGLLAGYEGVKGLRSGLT